MLRLFYPYKQIFDDPDTLPDEFEVFDNLLGFETGLVNPVLDFLDQYAASSGRRLRVRHAYVLDQTMQERRSNLDLIFSADLQYQYHFRFFEQYRNHPELEFQNFICSFNGTPNVGRKLLTAILHRRGWFNPEYTSKNFVYDIDTLDGHIQDYQGERARIYRKFFIDPAAEQFYNTASGFGHVRYEHDKNIFNLEHKLTGSFLHVVAESTPTWCYPYVTEKFLYSVVTRGLFLAWAQPGWHLQLEKSFGFKRYTNIFDYSFDYIHDPIERLLQLVNMISCFATLSRDEWHDLYLCEQDNIEFNIDHYHSGNYLRCLRQIEHNDS